MSIKLLDEAPAGATIKMSELKPLQGAVIVDFTSSHRGEVILRTASTNRFEAMCLSDPRPGNSWTTGCNLLVAPLAGPLVMQIDGV